jgi:hypothetical protein
MNKKKLIELLGGRVDFDIIEIDPELLLEVPPKDTSDNNIVSSDNITADKVRAWLKTLPEPTFEELQDYLWHDHK